MVPMGTIKGSRKKKEPDWAIKTVKRMVIEGRWRGRQDLLAHFNNVKMLSIQSLTWLLKQQAENGKLPPIFQSHLNEDDEFGPFRGLLGRRDEEWHGMLQAALVRRLMTRRLAKHAKEGFDITAHQNQQDQS